MILENLKVKKAIIIKTQSILDMEYISNIIHSQLMGKTDYIDSNIILSLGDGSNNEIPDNEIHVYIFDECISNPIIAIGKFKNSSQVIIDISVRNEIEELRISDSLHSQLENNRDAMFSNITVHDSLLKKDRDTNGYCVTVTYNKNRKSTPSLIL